MSDIQGVLLALGLLFVNSLFVALEFALVRVRPTQLEELREQGRPGAAAAVEMRKHLDVWLSTCQVGNTLASLALGWLGQPVFQKITTRVLDVITPASVQSLARPASVVVAFIIITFLHIVLGEQVPKMLAISHSARISVTINWPVRAFRTIFAPFIWLLHAGTNATLRLLGFRDTSSSSADVFGEAELRLLLASVAQAGTIPQMQLDLIDRALSMMEKTARQMMTPRSQLVALDLEDSLDVNIERALSSGLTWLIVVRGSLDRVEGVVNVKDLTYLHMRGELKAIGQAQRPVFFVPEAATLDQLVREFRRRNKSVAVVVDEHGGTSGFIGRTEVSAQLLGDFAELGGRAAPLKTLPGGRIELPGVAQLDDLEHTLDVEFDVDKSLVTTIAGYLMAKLGRIPVVGDFCILGDFRISVLAVEGPRVRLVCIEPRVQPPTSEEARASEVRTSEVKR